MPSQEAIDRFQQQLFELQSPNSISFTWEDWEELVPYLDSLYSHAKHGAFIASTRTTTDNWRCHQLRRARPQVRRSKARTDDKVQKRAPKGSMQVLEECKVTLSVRVQHDENRQPTEVVVSRANGNHRDAVHCHSLELLKERRPCSTGVKIELVSEMARGLLPSAAARKIKEKHSLAKLNRQQSKHAVVKFGWKGISNVNHKERPNQWVTTSKG